MEHAGHYPADSGEAINHLEELRAGGGGFLLLPATALWWLDHYQGFKEHLANCYRLVTRVEDTCLIYSLREKPPVDTASDLTRVKELVSEFQARYQRDPSMLDWHSGLGLAELFPYLPVISLAEGNGCLLYLDRSIDIVATNQQNPDEIAEARRVVGDGPTYISFDVDGLDPVYAPGTGTPEIGGITTLEAQRLLRGLRGLDLVGGDVVEVAPPYDQTGNTALVGATMMY